MTYNRVAEQSGNNGGSKLPILFKAVNSIFARNFGVETLDKIQYYIKINGINAGYDQDKNPEVGTKLADKLTRHISYDELPAIGHLAELWTKMREAVKQEDGLRFCTICDSLGIILEGNGGLVLPDEFYSFYNNGRREISELTSIPPAGLERFVQGSGCARNEKWAHKYSDLAGIAFREEACKTSANMHATLIALAEIGFVLRGGCEKLTDGELAKYVGEVNRQIRKGAEKYCPQVMARIDKRLKRRESGRMQAG
jgi:hypothetical protein